MTYRMYKQPAGTSSVRYAVSPPFICNRTASLCRDYPTTADSYELLEECGRGVSATVSVSNSA